VDVEGGHVAHVLGTGALAHTVGVYEEEVEGEEVSANGGVERSSSVEEELALVES
jgi:hypothetical protein